MFDTAKILNLGGSIGYEEGGIVSKMVIKKSAGNITLFAFEKGQGLSEHSAPFDAFVQIIEGNGRIAIGGHDHRLTAGEMIIMPANIPHSVHADERFKMMLVMIKG